VDLKMSVDIDIDGDIETVCAEHGE
jgi:hypothetical protein